MLPHEVNWHFLEGGVRDAATGTESNRSMFKPKVLLIEHVAVTCFLSLLLLLLLFLLFLLLLFFLFLLLLK